MANNLVARCDLRHDHALSPPQLDVTFRTIGYCGQGRARAWRFASAPGAIAGPPGPLWREPAATVVRSRSRR